MFHVTSVNLTPDLRSAAPDLGTCDFGEITADQLLAMLELLLLVEPVQNHEAEPQLVVETPAGKFRIRTGQGKLFFYNARNPTEVFHELTPSDVLRELQQSGLKAAASAERTEPAPEPPPAKTPHNGIAITILIAGLALNGYTLYSVFYIDDVNQKPPIELVTNPTELAALQHSAAGRYATGNTAGDRVIVVGPDATVRFYKVTAAGDRLDSNDTYRVGRHDGRLCLTMPDSGVIDINNIESIVYYRDVYRRTK